MFSHMYATVVLYFRSSQEFERIIADVPGVDGWERAVSRDGATISLCASSEFRVDSLVLTEHLHYLMALTSRNSELLDGFNSASGEIALWIYLENRDVNSSFSLTRDELEWVNALSASIHVDVWPSAVEVV